MASASCRGSKRNRSDGGTSLRNSGGTDESRSQCLLRCSRTSALFPHTNWRMLSDVCLNADSGAESVTEKGLPRLEKVEPRSSLTGLKRRLRPLPNLTVLRQRYCNLVPAIGFHLGWFQSFVCGTPGPQTVLPNRPILTSWLYPRRKKLCA